MFCIQNYCFSRKFIYEYLRNSQILYGTNNFIDIFVVVCIPTPEFQYCDDVWNQAQANQSKDRASTDVD